MFCHHCGQQLPDESRFCSGCGAELDALGHAPARATAPAQHDEGTPVLELRPQFVPSVQMAAFVPLFLFLGLWGGFFFGGFSQVFLGMFESDIPRWAPFVFFGAVFALVLPVFAFRAVRKTYAATTYRVFPHKLDYYEGFFTVEEKTVPLERVTEVNLRKGPLQRKHGLGTVVLSTPATSNRRATAGIRLNDVLEPDAVYAQVKELVEAAQRGHQRRAA